MNNLPVFTIDTIDLGIIEPDSFHFINFPFEGNMSDLVGVKFNCGCTGEEVYMGNKLQVQFKESDVKHITDFTPYSSGYYEFNKSFVVFFKSDIPLFELDDNGNSAYNFKKEHKVLSFTGKVKLK